MDYYVLTPISFLLRNFEVFCQFALMLILLNKKCFDKKHFFGTIIYSIIFEMAKLITPQYLLGFLSLILGIPFITIYFKQNFVKVFGTYALVGVLIAIVDYITLMGIAGILKLDDFSQIVESPVLYNLGCIVVSLTLLIIACILKNVEKIRSKFVFPKIFTTSLISIIVTFILLVPNLAMLIYYYDNKEIPLLLIVLNICAIILMFFVSTYNTRKGFELVAAEQELITQRTYNKTLQNLVDGLRTFKHDYNNTLQTMYGYVQLNNMTGLKKFFEQILDESRSITALDKLNPELFKNPSLFGIITAKYEYSRQNNVNMNFEMYGELENADMQIYDLTRILGIFLDNAIEASTGSDKKNVNFLVTERKELITVEISNTYSEVGLKLDEIDKKGISSKGENRGLGLYKVKEILKKYPNVKHETTALNGMFRQKLVINKVKVKV